MAGAAARRVICSAARLPRENTFLWGLVFPFTRSEKEVLSAGLDLDFPSQSL